MKLIRGIVVVMSMCMISGCVKEINIYYTINTTINANGIDTNLLKNIPYNNKRLRDSIIYKRDKEK